MTQDTTKSWEDQLKANFYDTDGDLCPEDADFESVKNFISNLLASQTRKVREEMELAFSDFMIDEYGYKGKYVEPDLSKKGHGTCCYCSNCGHPNDDCVCESNRIHQFLSTLSEAWEDNQK